MTQNQVIPAPVSVSNSTNPIETSNVPTTTNEAPQNASSEVSVADSSNLSIKTSVLRQIGAWLVKTFITG